MNLRRIYADICRGYSAVEWQDKLVYVKHLTSFDQVDIDEVRDIALADAIKRGIKTEDERLKWLEKRGLWNGTKEMELNEQRDYVKGLLLTKTKLIFRAQIDSHNITVDREQIKLNEMIAHKEGLIDLTAEHVADRKVQFSYIQQSFFEDQDLKKKLFTKEDMQSMDDDSTSELLSLYITNIGSLSTESIKSVAVSSYFTNGFYLCADNVSLFFGKPICQLTTQQVNLLSYGMYYRNILANNDVPEEIRDKPDRLEEYVNKSAAFKKILAKTGNAGRVGLMASAEDFKLLGINNDIGIIQEAASKEFKNGMEGANAMGYSAA